MVVVGPDDERGEFGSTAAHYAEHVGSGHGRAVGHAVHFGLRAEGAAVGRSKLMGHQLELRHAPREVVGGHLLAAGSDFAALHRVVGQGVHVGAEPLRDLWVGLGRLPQQG